MYRFDEGHAAPRPHFLDTPAQPKQHRSTLVGLAGLAVMLVGTAVVAGVWLGVTAAIAWRVFQWLT